MRGEKTRLTRNRIRNPLEGIPKAQLMHDVEAWCAHHSLTEHLAMFKKGALVAQNPPEAHMIDGEQKLSQGELTALDDEVTHKWRMPTRLFLTIATCSIGAAVQGWDQTGSNGAALFFPDVYGIGEDENGHTTDKNTLLVGLIMAGPYIGCA